MGTKAPGFGIRVLFPNELCKCARKSHQWTDLASKIELFTAGLVGILKIEIGDFQLAIFCNGVSNKISTLVTYNCNCWKGLKGKELRALVNYKCRNFISAKPFEVLALESFTWVTLPQKKKKFSEKM